jgi:hypothetical protein
MTKNPTDDCCFVAIHFDAEADKCAGEWPEHARRLTFNALLVKRPAVSEAMRVHESQKGKINHRTAPYSESKTRRPCYWIRTRGQSSTSFTHNVFYSQRLLLTTSFTHKVFYSD